MSPVVQRIVKLDRAGKDKLAFWLHSGTGSFIIGNVAFEAVEDGGILVRTQVRQAARRELAVVEREANIVEVLRGGKMTTPGIASVLAARQQPSRGMIAMVTQSLITLEHDGIVKRLPLMSGRRHWELA
jgi:hypothetical protein